MTGSPTPRAPVWKSPPGGAHTPLTTTATDSGVGATDVESPNHLDGCDDGPGLTFEQVRSIF